MALDDSDLDNGDLGNEGPPAAGAGSRTFLIVASIIGGLLLLSIAALGGYIFLRSTGRLPDQQATQRADRNAENTQIAVALTQTAQAALATTTTPTRTATATSSPTIVLLAPTDVEVSPTGEISPTVDPRTATVAALQTTQAALAPRTLTPTPSSLPDTGFAEDVGVPGLLGIALVLLVVIFLARRLRQVGG